MIFINEDRNDKKTKNVAEETAELSNTKKNVTLSKSENDLLKHCGFGDVPVNEKSKFTLTNLRKS